jgi:hypothetical protein
VNLAEPPLSFLPLTDPDKGAPLARVWHWALFAAFTSCGERMPTQPQTRNESLLSTITP